MAHEFSRTDFSSVSWVDPGALPESWARRGLRFLLVVSAHVAVIGGAMELASRPAVRHAVEQLYVRLVELPAPVPTPPVVQEVKPPPKKAVVRQPLPEPPAPPILTATPAATDIPPVASFVVAPQPLQPPPPPLAPIQAAAPAPPTPAALTAARFDADYLHNPKPVYPPAARRLSEAGVVHLRVQVSANGATLAVEVRQSSGYPRLDAAALDAVRRWRFVPARQGADSIESWVTVPIAFKLES